MGLSLFTYLEQLVSGAGGLYYIRYADDFVFLSHDYVKLRKLLPYIVEFLHDSLKLELHPKKVSLRTLISGVDFLGWVHFPNHRVLRTSTKKRMLRYLKKPDRSEKTLASYLGLLSHGNTHILRQIVAAL